MSESFKVPVEGPEEPAQEEEVTIDFGEQLPEEVIHAYEIKERTNDLEARIEREQATEIKEKIGLAQRIVEGLKKRGEKTLRMATLLVALGLSGYDKADASETTQREHEYRPPTKEQRMQVTKETGIDIFSIAESAHFNAEIQVPSENGKYILHVGQSHYVKDLEEKIEDAHGVAEVQRGIEKILSVLAAEGIRDILSEARTEETPSLILNRAKETRQMVSKVTADEKCFDILAQECKQQTEWYHQRNNSASDELAIGVKNLFKKRAMELHQELERKGMLTPPVVESFGRALNEFQPFGVFSKLGDDAVYLLGAREKLEWEGNLIVHPAETDEGNQGAFKLEPEFEQVKSNYFRADFKTIPISEVEALAAKYIEVKKKYDYAVHEFREDIAVQMVEKYAESSPERMIPLVYGSAHDFKNSVVQYNFSHESHMGLIKITSSDIKTPPETNTKPN